MMLQVGTGTLPAGIGSVTAEMIEYVKLTATFAGVVAFAVIALRLWATRLASGPVARDGPLHVAWRLNLEPRRTLYLVRAGSGYLLLASSETGVQLLTQLETGDIDLAVQDRARKPFGGFEFATLLRSLRRPQPGERAE